MIKFSISIFCIILFKAFFAIPIYAQTQQFTGLNKIELPKVVTSSYGIAFGINQGKYTAFEAGLERYWGRMSITKPRTSAVAVLATINPWRDVAGVTAHAWTRSSRFGPTYGISGGYHSNFDSKSRIAIGPTLGYRMLGVHLTFGYNFLLGDKTLDGVNSYYGTLRFYVPLKKDIQFKKK